MARKWNDQRDASALKSAEKSSNKSIVVSDPTREMDTMTSMSDDNWWPLPKACMPFTSTSRTVADKAKGVAHIHILRCLSSSGPETDRAAGTTAEIWQ